METALSDGKQAEWRKARGEPRTYGFADQVNYSVGLAACSSLLVSLILSLSASCFLLLFSLLPLFSFSPLVSLLVTLFPYYPVTLLRASSLSRLNDPSFPLFLPESPVACSYFFRASAFPSSILLLFVEQEILFRLFAIC